MAIVDADTSARNGWTMAALADAFLRGGATLLQVRNKAGASRALLEGASTIVAAARFAVAQPADVTKSPDDGEIHAPSIPLATSGDPDDGAGRLGRVARKPQKRGARHVLEQARLHHDAEPSKCDLDSQRFKEPPDPTIACKHRR